MLNEYESLGIYESNFDEEINFLEKRNIINFNSLDSIGIIDEFDDALDDNKWHLLNS